VLDLEPHGSFDDTKVYEVPEGYVFAIGDNRDKSLDSRFDKIGFIPLGNLIGRAGIVFFSINDSANWLASIRFSRMLSRIV
jgi:signal peptidase I